MAYKVLEGVQQYVTGTGTGALTCGAATSVLFRGLDAAGMQNGDRTRVRIQDPVNIEDWEIVLIEYNDGVIERVVDGQFSSRTGSLIDFQAGDKIISSVVVARDLYSHGRFSEKTAEIVDNVLTLDVVIGGYYKVTNDADISSIVLSGLTSGMTCYIEFVSNGIQHTQDWGDWCWLSDVPVLTDILNGKDIIELFSPDGDRVFAIARSGQNNRVVNYPLWAPDAVLQQKLAMYMDRSDLSAERAPQGMAQVVVSGVQYLILNQRVQSGLPGERHQFALYEYKEDQSHVPSGLFTELIWAGHQGLGAYVDGDDHTDNVVMWTAAAYRDYTLPRAYRNGLTKITGFKSTTNDADAKHYRLLNGLYSDETPDADDTFINPNSFSSRFFGDSGLCSDDGKYVIMVTSNSLNRYRSDGVTFVIGWLREEVEAAPLVAGETNIYDATGVKPAFQFHLKVPPALDGDCYQDFACRDGIFYAFSGQTSPLGRHYIQMYQLNGTGAANLLREVNSNDARGPHGREGMFGRTIEGEPSFCTSMEAEGIAIIKDAQGTKIVTVTQEVWKKQTGTSIVSSDGLNWANLFTGTPGRPGWTDEWTQVLAEASGPWVAGTLYTGMSDDTWRTATVCTVQIAPDGEIEAGAWAMDNGLYPPESTSPIPLARAEHEFSVRPGSGVSIAAYSGMAGSKYYPWFDLTADALNIRDGTATGIDFFKTMSLNWSFSSGREYIQLRHGGTDGTIPVNTGPRLNLYGPNDSERPSIGMLAANEALDNYIATGLGPAGNHSRTENSGYNWSHLRDGVWKGGIYLSANTYRIGWSAGDTFIIASTTDFTTEPTTRFRIDGSTFAVTPGTNAAQTLGTASLAWSTIFSLPVSSNLGTVSSGTTTPNPAIPVQRYTNNGAHTLAPGSVEGYYIMKIANGASAGAITTSGWTIVIGDLFDTTSGSVFICSCIIVNGTSVLSVRKAT